MGVSSRRVADVGHAVASAPDELAPDATEVWLTARTPRRRRLLGRPNVRVGSVAAIIAALGVAMTFEAITLGPAGATTPILTAARDLPAGTILDASDVRISLVPTEDVGRDVLRPGDPVDGAVVSSHLVLGAPLTPASVPGTILRGRVSAPKHASDAPVLIRAQIALPATDGSGQSNLRPGMQIRIVASAGSDSGGTGSGQGAPGRGTPDPRASRGYHPLDLAVVGDPIATASRSGPTVGAPSLPVVTSPIPQPAPAHPAASPTPGTSTPRPTPLPTPTLPGVASPTPAPASPEPATDPTPGPLPTGSPTLTPAPAPAGPRSGTQGPTRPPGGTPDPPPVVTNAVVVAVPAQDGSSDGRVTVIVATDPSKVPALTRVESESGLSAEVVLPAASAEPGSEGSDGAATAAPSPAATTDSEATDRSTLDTESPSPTQTPDDQ